MFEFDFGKGKELQKGQLLIAEPFLRDPNFARSVILLCEHNDKGSFGLVLNRATELTVAEATESLNSQNTLYVGGPVEQNTLHFVHKIEGIQGSVALRDGLFWGGSYPEIKDYVINGFVNEENCRFFMGYCGWGEGQLKEEMEQNTWIISEENISALPQSDYGTFWQNSLRKMGGEYHVLSNYPIDPRLN